MRQIFLLFWGTASLLVRKHVYIVVTHGCLNHLCLADRPHLVQGKFKNHSFYAKSEGVNKFGGRGGS